MDKKHFNFGSSIRDWSTRMPRSPAPSSSWRAAATSMNISVSGTPGCARTSSPRSRPSRAPNTMMCAMCGSTMTRASAADWYSWATTPIAQSTRTGARGSMTSSAPPSRHAMTNCSPRRSTERPGSSTRSWRSTRSPWTRCAGTTPWRSQMESPPPSSPRRSTGRARRRASESPFSTRNSSASTTNRSANNWNRSKARSTI